MSNRSPASAKKRDRKRKRQKSHSNQLKKARWERTRSWASWGWKIFGVIFLLLGAVPTIQYFSTRIAVTSVGTVSGQDPMGTVFNVTNNGPFTLRNDSHACAPETVDPHAGATFGGI